MPFRRPRYGLDAPRVLAGFLLSGLAALIVGEIIVQRGDPLGTFWPVIAVLFFWTAFWLLLTGVVMLASSVFGKLRLRDRVLDSLGLTGDETVLDVGCGRGLMLIGAAKRVPRGQAIGVDIWSQRDQWRNNAAETMANAESEGVADRITLRDADMRELPFGDDSIDVVVSSLAIHNLPKRTDRRRAVDEIVRVLKPGGHLALVDIARTREYARDLRRAGLRAVHRSGRSYWVYPPVRIVTATKGGHRGGSGQGSRGGAES
jgi:SAM-dependent methyltransferase